MRIRALVLIVATSFGCSSESHPGFAPPLQTTGDAASPTTDGGDDAPADAASILTFSKWASPTIWTQLARTIAVDGQENVYVTDRQVVYRLDKSGTASVYLTRAELQTAIESTTVDPKIESIDVDANGQLYLLHTGYNQRVLVSSAPHVVSTYAKLDGATIVFPHFIAAVSADRVLGIDSQGLFDVTKTSVDRIYATSQVGAGSGCQNEALAANRDGYFYYTPGCPSSDVHGGKSDGSGVGIVLRYADAFHGDTMHSTAFTGFARDPLGTGAFVAGEEGIFYLDEQTAWHAIQTSPSLGDLGRQQKLTNGFDFAAIGAGPSGALYLVAPNDGLIFRASK